MEEEIVLMEENDVEEINIEEENYSGKPYELPIASKNVLGGIKVGENLTIDEDGTLNAQAGGSGSGTKNILTATLPASVTIAETNASQKITGYVETVKIGDKFRVENGVIKIGAGVSKVKLSYTAGLEAAKSTTGGFTYIIKNGSPISQEVYTFSSQWQSVLNVVPPIIVDVTEGDEITLMVYGYKGNKLQGTDRFVYKTHFTIEELL